MNTFIKSIYFTDREAMLRSPHPLLAFPPGMSVKKGDAVLLYEKKTGQHGGYIVGEAKVIKAFHLTLNEERRVGPPRKLFRYWAEVVFPTPEVVEGLDELGTFELTNYRKGSVLDWIWSKELIRHIKETDEWPGIETISKVTGLSPMKCWAKSDEIRKSISACEHWLEQSRLISQFGEYTDAGVVAVIETEAFHPEKSLSEYGLSSPPRGTKLLFSDNK